MRRSRKDTAQILVERGSISADQAKQAAKLVKGSGKRIEEAIVEAGFAPEESVASTP